MVKIRRVQRYGMCNDCGKPMDTDVPVWEIKVSNTGRGWTTIMLCKECMLSLHTAMAVAATQH